MTTLAHTCEMAASRAGETRAEGRAPAVEDDLIARCRRGDMAAFDELVERIKRPAFALAYRLTRDREQAFDVVQESCIKLYAFLPRWNYRCKVQTWLYRVISNACVDWHRRQRLRFVSLQDDERSDALEARAAAAADDPSEELQRREMIAALLRGVEALPEQMRECCRLRYFGGLSLQEIADIRGCSIGTVKATVHRAVKKLRSRIKNEEGGQR